MIAELCPNGVGLKTLEEVAQYAKTRIPSTEITKENYVGVDNLLPEKQGKTDSLYAPETGVVIRYEPNDILIGNIRPYLKKIWRSDRVGGTNGDVLVVHINNKNMSAEYLYYVLSSDDFFLYNMQHSKGAKMPRGSKEAIMRYPIPLPPLPVQQEIVRILDKFTELTAELTAELSARRAQYSYYRDDLLNLGSEVERVKLGQIGEVTKLAGFEFTEHVKYSDAGHIIALRGLNVKKGYLELANVKYIDGSNFNKLPRSKLYKNDMLFTYVGTIGEVALIDEDDRYYLAPNVARIRFTNKAVNPIFMRYYFQTWQFEKEQINRYLSTSSMKNLTMENIRKFELPLPSLAEQERIVAILDRFDKLTTDIAEGLPAEIVARKKQYEWYRDRLLRFEKNKEVENE